MSESTPTAIFKYISIAAKVKRRTVKEYTWETILEIHELEFNIDTILGWLNLAVKNWVLEGVTQFKRFRG